MLEENRLYNRRKELGLTLEQVAKICGVGKSTVKKWETGYIENMKRDKIPLLAKALQVDINFIFGEKNITLTAEKDDERNELYNKIMKKVDKMSPEQLKRFEILVSYALLSDADFEKLLKLADIVIPLPPEYQ